MSNKDHFMYFLDSESWQSIETIKNRRDQIVHWAIKSPHGGGTNHHLMIQRIKNGPVMVRAGCRYFTLKEASKHWNVGESYRNKGTIIAIRLHIATLVAIARAQGWTKENFNPAIPKRKSKVKKAVKKTARRR